MRREACADMHKCPRVLSATVATSFYDSIPPVSEARFHGVIASQDAGWLWPDSRLLSAAWGPGVTVNIEVTDAGLTFSPRTHVLRGKRWAPVTLAWSELGGASARSRGHTGRTGGLTLQETFVVTLEVVGPRAAGFQVSGAISSLLPGFPSDVDIVDHAGYAPLVVTMPHGDELAAAVTSRATGKTDPRRRS